MMGPLLWATALAATMRPGVRYYGRRWNFIARTRRALDGRRCARCGRRGLVLHVHHKRPVHAGGNHFLWNLVTLCVNCHELAHQRDLNRNREVGR